MQGMQDFLEGSRQDSAVELSLQFYEHMTLSGFWQSGLYPGFDEEDVVKHRWQEKISGCILDMVTRTREIGRWILVAIVWLGE